MLFKTILYSEKQTAEQDSVSKRGNKHFPFGYGPTLSPRNHCILPGSLSTSSSLSLAVLAAPARERAVLKRATYLHLVNGTGSEKTLLSFPSPLTRSDQGRYSNQGTLIPANKRRFKIFPWNAGKCLSWSQTSQINSLLRVKICWGKNTPPSSTPLQN